MYVIPEVNCWWIIIGYGFTEILNTFINLPHLEIGYTPIGIGTYLRQFSRISQTVGNSKKTFKIASKPGSQHNAVGLGLHDFVGNIAQICTFLFRAARYQ